MRIICPNCLAEYEVHDTALPAPGRDVQCSNCGHGWFQPAPSDAETAAPASGVAAPQEAEAEAAPDTPPPAPPTVRSDTDAPPDDLASPSDAPAAVAEPDLHPQDTRSDTDSEPAPVALPRRIDDDVLSVLREEAEHEIRARRAEALEMQVQDDLGLDAAGPHGGPRPRRPVVPEDAAPTPRPSRRPPRAEVSVMPAAAAATAVAAAPTADSSPAPGNRRNRLPDIEEVSGKLGRTAVGDGADADADKAAGRSGFRLGFLLVLLIAAVALALYALAPHIATALPATEPALTAYTGMVDAARLWVAQRIDALVQAVVVRLA